MIVDTSTTRREVAARPPSRSASMTLGTQGELGTGEIAHGQHQESIVGCVGFVCIYFLGRQFNPENDDLKIQSCFNKSAYNIPK